MHYFSHKYSLVISALPSLTLYRSVDMRWLKGRDEPKAVGGSERGQGGRIRCSELVHAAGLHPGWSITAGKSRDTHTVFYLNYFDVFVTHRYLVEPCSVYIYSAYWSPPLPHLLLWIVELHAGIGAGAGVDRLPGLGDLHHRHSQHVLQQTADWTQTRSDWTHCGHQWSTQQVDVIIIIIVSYNDKVQDNFNQSRYINGHVLCVRVPLSASQQTYSCSCDGTILQWDTTSLKVKRQFRIRCDRLSSIQVHDGTLWCCKCTHS